MMYHGLLIGIREYAGVQQICSRQKDERHCFGVQSSEQKCLHQVWRCEIIISMSKVPRPEHRAEAADRQHRSKTKGLETYFEVIQLSECISGPRPPHL